MGFFGVAGVDQVVGVVEVDVDVSFLHLLLTNTFQYLNSPVGEYSRQHEGGSCLESSYYFFSSDGKVG